MDEDGVTAELPMEEMSGISSLEDIPNENGNNFQKTNKYLKFLPLPEVPLAEDADFFFQEVKRQLSSSILLLDIKQGARFWSDELDRYILLFGLRFTKEDHIDLVKLFFELIVTVDLELSLTHTFVGTFNRLLKKKELLSPAELSLPWRPVYKLWESISDSKDDSYGRKFLPPYAESTVRKFIKNCRVYFPVEATAEMLEEWGPLFCPFDTSMMDAFELLDLFLPTTAPVDRHDRMYRLWFAEFMGLYENMDGSKVGWDAKFLGIFSRVAGHNIGLIDWEPHLPTIFSRILRAFGLPVGPATYQLSHSDPSYEFCSSCLWIVAMISPTNNCLKFISKLCKAIEPFMHPSNHGWFQRSLHGALSKLCSIFTARVKLERYKKPTWDNYIPEDQKLTDEQITEFVDIVKPLIFTGLFSKYGPQDMTSALFNLSFLRPERVLPQHLENLYPALENLTEPHRLKATLSGTLGIVRAMLVQPERYPEGRLHIIPILNLCLPGIDSNDCHKTMTTLQLITTIATLISMVDCSDAYQLRSDLTENEQELCSQTAQLQDFIFIFIDRLFSLIEGLSLDHHESAAARAKASSTEAAIETMVRSATSSVFQQTSLDLFKPAFEKVWNHMSSKVYEVLVAGRLAGAVLYGLASVRPGLVLPRVVPYCCSNILELTEHKDVATDARADNSLLWNLLLLSEVTRVDGEEVVKYSDSISQVLERTLHMTNISAHSFACSVLERYMRCIGSIYPTEFMSLKADLDKPVTDHLPIRSWGMHCPDDKLQIQWHIPGDKQLQVLQRLFSKLVLDELKYLDETEQLEREELQRRLKVISECVKGAGEYMPSLESNRYQLDDEGVVHRKRYAITANKQKFTITLDGENARNRILRTLQPLMLKLLDKVADSAKPLFHIANIYKLLMLNFGTEKETIDLRASSLKAIKKTLENPLKPRASDVRYVRIQLTFVTLCRILHAQVVWDPFTELHAQIYQDLVKMATSNYEDVQGHARQVLGKFFKQYRGTERLIIPSLCKLLITPPPQVSEEQFKGALSLVLSTDASNRFNSKGAKSLAVRKDLVVQQLLWPAIVQAQHSEKPDIQLLVDKIVKRVEKSYQTLYFDFPVTKNALAAAEVIRSSCVLAEVNQVEGQQAAELRTEKYKQLHNKLLTELLDLLASNQLQWKHREFAMVMVALLQRPDQKSSLAEVKLYTDNLVHDSVVVRKMCIGTVTGLLYSQKHRHERQYVPSSEFTSYESFQYHPDDIPDNEQAWAKANFVEKTFYGCMKWPERFQVTRSCPAPSPDQISEVDRYVLDKFAEKEFTDKLFSYLALESKKNDSFCSRNYTFFKCLARNYGPPIVNYCKASIEQLLSDKEHKTENSRQRLVSEFVAGMIRGSKYWSFQQMNEMFDWILPMVKRAITNVSTEVMSHWGTAFATCCEDREPKKLYRLFQFLLEEVKAIGHDADSTTSLETTSRLYFLQGALGQQQWRVPELNTYTTNLIRERMASPFKSIRSRLGSVLCSCYVFDLPYINKDCWHNPTRAEMVNSFLPMVRDLEFTTDSELAADNGKGSPPAAVEDVEMASTSEEPMEEELVAPGNELADEQKKKSKLILKTLLTWLVSNFERHTTYQRWTPEVLHFLPIVCPHTSNFSDPELRALSVSVAASMSKTLLPKQLLPQFIHTIKETIGLGSWHARVTLLEVLQSMMFLNQFILSGDYGQQLQDVIVHLLSDERIEVKLAAATTLSGGIQFQFFDVEDRKLLDHFKKQANTQLKSKKGSKLNRDELLQRCHTGLLGLGAIVTAYPYEVPHFVPELLMILSDHIHDPQPIQKTVKDVLSEFKRTHLDNWLDHKQKFTDDQLVVLTNILVSPNYYA